jgi:hypothetical protein
MISLSLPVRDMRYRTDKDSHRRLLRQLWARFDDVGTYHLDVRFCYLIQGEAESVASLCGSLQTSHEIFALTYDQVLPQEPTPRFHHLYFPRSTWAEGRNYLLTIACATRDFDYFIFLDDDALLPAHFAEQFETLLGEHRPAVAVPLTDEVAASGRFNPRQAVQLPVGFDQVVQAYSRDAVAEGIVVPFVTAFDALSWWYACEINQYLALRFYSKSCLQFNLLRVGNGRNALSLGDGANPSSRYQGGRSPEGLDLVREYIVDRFGPQRTLKGSLFDERNTRQRPLGTLLARLRNIGNS